jgi:enamine deaminase RidA (YjgF/YER057c/UK114 family)
MLASLEALLARAGSGKGRLLLATLYLVDMADYDVVNAVWDAWVPAGTAPARACVQVGRLASPGWKVEIAVQAAVGG